MLNYFLIAIISAAAVSYLVLYIRLLFKDTLTRLDFFLVGPLKKQHTFFQTHQRAVLKQIQRIYTHYFLFLVSIDLSLLFREQTWVWMILLIVIVLAFLCWRTDKKYEQIIKTFVREAVPK